MKPYQDETVFNWIRNGRDAHNSSEDSRWTGNFVSHLMPNRFESYAKILHLVEGRYDNVDSPLTPQENSILKIPDCEKLKSLVVNMREISPEPRILWKTIGDSLGVPLSPEIKPEWYRTKIEPGCWPRFLIGPADGSLSDEECVELASLLEPFIPVKECFFRFSEIQFIATDKPLLFRGELDKISQFLADGRYQFGPEYWWPTDREWCVCSDYDLEYTIVGGCKELVASFLTSTVLECLEVTPKTRIDYLAPMP